MHEEEQTEFKQSVKQLYNKLQFSIKNFVQSWKQFKLYPRDQEVSLQYYRDKKEFIQTVQYMATIAAQISTAIQTANHNLIQYNIEIKEEKKKDVILNKQIYHLTNKKNASEELYEDDEYINTIYRLTNWSILLSSVAVIVAIVKIKK